MTDHEYGDTKSYAQTALAASNIHFFFCVNSLILMYGKTALFGK